VQTGVRGVLHDAPFGLALTAANELSPTASVDGNDATPDPLQRRFTFSPSHEGQRIGDLPVVHEHPMHLTIVSADLRRFDHVHPVPRPDGTLQLDYRFPAAGQYLMFAEYMPRGERDQVFRFPVTVGPPASGEPTPAVLRLTDRGQPVTDLEPYMGAMGHCAIISEDTQMFLHCHPEQLFPPRRTTRGGPDIAFCAMFPSPGRYKVWGQFQRGGKVVVADFVVNVEASVLPPRVVNFILGDN
jgi:hypothetical protein